MPKRSINFRLDEEFIEQFDKFSEELNLNRTETLIYLFENFDKKESKNPSSESYKNCFYRAEDPKDSDFVYCATKRIAKSVCIAQQKRFLHTNNICRPLHIKKSRSTRKSFEEKKRKYTCINCSSYRNCVNPETKKFAMPVDPICERFRLSSARKNWNMEKIESGLTWDDEYKWRGSRPSI